MIMRISFAALVLVALAGCASFTGSAAANSQGPDRPDPRLTPGAIDTGITQANIDSTICKPNYTTTVRPPARVTNGLKRAQLTSNAYPDKTMRDYEEDHLIGLEIGGAPRDPRNLWPEHWADPWGAHTKDQLENRLHRLVCNHALPLSDAQHAIASDWIAAFRKYVNAISP
jgi:hypothetical protein